MRKILFLILIIMILTSCNTYTNRVGLAITTTQGEDKIALQKNDLIECCNFIDETGKSRTCAVVSRHGCDICKEKCG